VAIAAVVGYSVWHRKRGRQRVLIEDYQAAFPTAQWVCAMRATDAASASPKIGSNVGAGPDTLAATLAGEAGMAILDASAKKYAATPETLSMSVVARTLSLDTKWVTALNEGCKQFVILGVGLDARAWRMPRMDKSVKVFEVDVPNAHRYKAERLDTLDEAPPLACTRVVVEADLSEPGWVDMLQVAGFEPSQPSFFLVEGLLMYLPPAAPEALLRATAGLMSSGSTLTGDTFVDTLSVMDQSFVQSLGTKWTFDFPTRDAIHTLLTTVGMSGCTVEGVDEGPQAPGEVGYVEEKARKMQQVALSLAMWPAGLKVLMVPKLLSSGEEGVRQLMAQIVNDKMNMHGLANVDVATKATIVDLALATPLTGAQHGSTRFGEALLAEAHEIMKGADMQRSRLRQWCSACAYMFKMMRHHMRGKTGGMTYVIYVAKK
jgi:methyltransferase (TIGR00027 family)